MPRSFVAAYTSGHPSASQSTNITERTSETRVKPVSNDISVNVTVSLGLAQAGGDGALSFPEVSTADTV